MSRILRYFFIGILSVVAVVALCVGVLVNIFDPNDYKERIQSEVKSQTGSNLLLEGEISYTVFPTIGLSIPHIELSKNQRAGESPELSVDNLSFGLNVLGLLSKSIEFSGRADRIVFVKPAQT
ncbi:MAG: AsmA family protein, partial [Arenicellales bacterium]